MKKKEESIKQLAMGMAAYTSASILGPLIVFGGVGMILDNLLGKQSLYLIIGIAIAFFITNIMLFRKMRKLSADMANYSKEISEKKETEKKKQEEMH